MTVGRIDWALVSEPAKYRVYGLMGSVGPCFNDNFENVIVFVLVDYMIGPMVGIENQQDSTYISLSILQ